MCHTLQESSELSIKDFYCVFVRTEMNLIAFSGPRNCVNMQHILIWGYHEGLIHNCSSFNYVLYSHYKKKRKLLNEFLGG